MKLKKVLFMLVAITLFAGCSADIVGLDGGSYSPDALLVHDQMSYWVAPLLLIVVVMLFVIAKRLKVIAEAIKYTSSSNSTVDDAPADKDFKDWKGKNPGRNINDYYRERK